MFGSLFVIYPSGRWPLGNITNKFLTAGVYLTYTPLGHGLYITYICVCVHAYTGILLPVRAVGVIIRCLCVNPHVYSASARQVHGKGVDNFICLGVLRKRFASVHNYATAFTLGHTL